MTRRSKIIWSINSALLVLIALTAIFWKQLVVSAVKYALSSRFAKQSGVEVTLADVQVSLLPPRLFISNVQANFERGPLERLKLDQAVVKLSLTPALSGNIVVDEVTIIHPTLWINPSRVVPEKETQKKDSFELPLPSNLIEFEIRKSSIEQAELNLVLPGNEDLRVVITQGAGSFSSDRKEQRIEWNGSGKLVHKGKSVSFDKVAIQAKSTGKTLDLANVAIEGIGANLAVKGTILPETALTLEGAVNLDTLQEGLAEIGVVKEKKPISGDVQLAGKIDGEWTRLNYSGSLRSDELGVGNRKLTNVSIRGKGTSKKIQIIEANFQLRKAKVYAALKDPILKKGAQFEVVTHDFYFEEFEHWLKPDGNPILKGLVDLTARGTLNFQPFTIRGDYAIKSPQLAFNFKPQLRQFLPLQFNRVEIAGKLQGTQARLDLTDGTLKAVGLEAEHAFQFPFKETMKGTWKGKLSEAGGIFAPNYPVKGNVDLGGGLELNGSKFQVKVDLKINQLQFNQRPPVKGGALLVFENNISRVTQVKLEGAGAAVDFDSEFHSEHDGRSWLKGNFKNLELGWVSDLAAIPYPFLKDMTGISNGRIELDHMDTAMGGAISLQADRVAWEKLPPMKIDANVKFVKGDAYFENTKLSFVGRDESYVVASGGVGKTGWKDFGIEVKNIPGSMIGVPEILHKNLVITEGEVRADGPTKSPQLSGQIDYTAGDVLGRATVGGTSEVIAWATEFGAGQFSAKGTYHTAHSELVADADYRALNLKGFIPSFETSLTGQAHFEGPLKKQDMWRGQAFFQEAILFKNIKTPIALLEPWTLVMKNGGFRVDPSYWGNEQDKLEVRGTVHTNGSLAGDIKGDVNLEILSSLIPAIKRADGKLLTSIQVGGSLKEPYWTGSFEVKNGFIQLREFPHPFENINLTGGIERHLIFIDKLNSDFAEGALQANGRVTMNADWKKTELSIQGDVSRAHLRFPPWLPITTRGIFELTGPLITPTLSGDFFVEEARYQDEWDWKSKVLSFRKTKVSQKILRPGDSTLKFNLHFVTDRGGFRVDNSVAQARLTGDVSLTGSIHSLGLIGKVDVLGGTVKFLDNRFTIDSGQITFTDRETIRAVFDLNARTRVQQTDIFLDIRTQGDDIVAFLSSNPVKDETNLISLLTLGVDSDQLFFNKEGGAAGGSNLSSSVVPGVLAGPVQSRLQEGLQETRLVDTIQFVPYFSDQSRETGLRMVLGKELFPKVQLLYSTDLFNIGAENTLRLQQDISERVFVQGSVRDNRVDEDQEIDLGVDFEFRLDF